MAYFILNACIFLQGLSLSNDIETVKGITFSETKTNVFNASKFLFILGCEFIFYIYSFFLGGGFWCQRKKNNENMVVVCAVNVLIGRYIRWQKNSLFFISKHFVKYFHREFSCFHQSTSIQ